jgi:hypothetical protein
MRTSEQVLRQQEADHDIENSPNCLYADEIRRWQNGRNWKSRYPRAVGSPSRTPTGVDQIEAFALKDTV